MSVIFTLPFFEFTIHVLRIRGRVAFVARNIGLAAGFSDGGQSFIDLIIREWAASFEEDDDIAQITGADLDVLKREVPLPDDTNMELVLFASGVDHALTRSHARNARSLLGFLHSNVLARVHTLYGGDDTDDDGSQGGAPAAPQAPIAEVTASVQPGCRITWHVVSRGDAASGLEQELLNAFAALDGVTEDLPGPTAEARPGRQPLDERGFEVIVKLAEDLYEENMISDEEWRDLRVEAAELFLGRPLRTRLSFGTPNLPFAA